MSCRAGGPGSAGRLQGRRQRGWARNWVRWAGRARWRLGRLQGRFRRRFASGSSVDVTWLLEVLELKPELEGEVLDVSSGSASTVTDSLQRASYRASRSVMNLLASFFCRAIMIGTLVKMKSAVGGWGCDVVGGPERATTEPGECPGSCANFLARD